MLGAFFAYTTLLLVPNFWVGLVLATVFVGILALGIEYFMFRRLYGNDPIFHLLLTFGLAYDFFGSWPEPFGVGLQNEWCLLYQDR